MSGANLDVLPRAIDLAAAGAPDREAVRCAGQALTYAELAERSDRLAGMLRAEGVRRGDRVGIHAGKGLAGTVAMYGIMKAGAAYVPLDPASPPARQAFVVRDCGIRHLVTEPSRAAALDALLAEGVPVGCVIGVAGDRDGAVRAHGWDEVTAHPPLDGRDALEASDLAYILYTSGSTGTPKGVMHSHASAVAFARLAAEAYGFTAGDRFCNHAPLHFDLSTLDYFSSAIAGGTTVIIPDAYTRVPASLSALIEAERLTVLYAVPLALTQLVLHGALEKRDLTAVRWVLFGGEPFPPKHLRALMAALPRARFSNVYGPTEVNGVTCWMLPERLPDGDAAVPIGRPFPGIDVRIVNGDGSRLPDEAAGEGELIVRTPTMMRGYWNRPELDARVFLRSPNGGRETVWVRTGDLVRRRDDGLLEFLGRKDRQMKIRGHRFELDEVEAALLAHAEVETAAVYPVEAPGAGVVLAAAVILRPPGSATGEVLRTHLTNLLPRYAVPERIDVLAEMPRTASGKIDRQALIGRGRDRPTAPEHS